MSLLGGGALLAGGIILLYLGAESLVRGSAALALRLGMSPLVVGLTIVALGTSSPELVVCLEAAIDGRGDLAIGSVVGSNISNLALILGSAALIRPLATRRRLIRHDMSIVIVCTALLVLLLLDGRLTRIEGVILSVALIAYLVLSVTRVRRGKPPSRVEGARVPKLETGFAWRDAMLLIGGAGLLVVGADTLLRGAVATAALLGIHESVIGLTLVALSTSLPELATSTVAALKREGEIAVGNVIGSNVLNILGILGPAALVSPLTSLGVGLEDLGAMMAITLVALFFMWTGLRLARWEGLAMLGFYGFYVTYLIT